MPRVDHSTYGMYVMTYRPDTFIVRRVDLDASLSKACSWCRHSEFIHGERGPCLYSECECPLFFPMA